MAFLRCGALAVRIVLASYLERGASTTAVILPPLLAATRRDDPGAARTRTAFALRTE
jgi:hypothetical protein